MEAFHSGPDFPNHPVVGVSWQDAKDYAEWRGKADPDTYFPWTWSVAGQVGLLIERNALAAKLEQTNATLEQTVEERTQDLATALDRLSAANEMMEHAGKLASIGELAANLVHELNTPLTVILGYAQLIGLKLGEDCREVAQLSAQATRMRRIVGNVLSLSRRQKPEINPTSLAETLATVKELIAYELNKHRVELRIELPADLPRVMADPVQLEHVFLNLVVNACQAIGRERGGEIVVRAHADAKTVVAEVRDNGPGIPKEVIDRIFEPFFTTKPAGKGTGLGLAISRRMLEAQDATIGVANAPDGGAAFTLTFPQAGAAEAEAAAASDAAVAAPSRPSVLVVNSDPDLCQMLVTVLERDDCRPRSATTSDEAMKLLAHETFDAVVVSVGDSLGGLAVLEEAREANVDIAGKGVVIAADSPSADERRTMQILRAHLLQGTAAYARLARAVRSVVGCGP
jgi:signal transduction histidine kinase